MESNSKVGRWLIPLVLVAGGAVWWLLRGDGTGGAVAPAGSAASVAATTIASEPALSRAPASRDGAADAAIPESELKVVVTHAPDGAPLESAEVILVLASGTGSPRAWRAATDRDGRCLLRVSESTVDEAMTTRFAPWLRGASSLLLAHVAGHVWHIERPCSLEAGLRGGDERELSRAIALKDGIQLRGRVSEGGRAVAGATLFAGGDNGVGDLVTKLDRFDAATGSDGVFEIGLVKGESPALDFAMLDLFAIEKSGAAHVLIPRAEALEISLAIDRVKLVVDVTDEAKSPIPGATALARPATGGGEAKPASMLVYYPQELVTGFLSATAGPRGRAVLLALPKLTDTFRFAVDVSAQGFQTTTLDVAFGEGEREKTVAAELKRSGGVAIHGVVRDVAGKPIVGARIEGGNNSSPPITTDAEGRYRYDGLSLSKQGWWYPRVNAEGYVEAGQNLNLNGKGSDFEFDFALWKIAPVAGVVVDQAGAPIPEATVYLSNGREDAPFPGSVKTDAAGRFAFERGGEGTWTIRAAKKTEPEQPFAYAFYQGLVEGGVQDFVVVLERIESGASIDVEVTRAATGDAVVAEGVLVDELGKIIGGHSLRRIEPQVSNGRVLCEGVAAGRYRVWAMAGSELGSVDVEVPNASAHVKAKLAIGATGSIRGRIVSPVAHDEWQISLQAGEGWLRAPRDGAWSRLYVAGRSGVLAQTLSASDRTFAFENVPAGPVILEAGGRNSVAGLNGRTDVRVRPGDTTEVEIVAAIRTHLGFKLTGVPEAVIVDFVVRDATGREETFSEHGRGQHTPGPLEMQFPVVAGECKWTIETSTILSGGKRVTWQPRREGTVTIKEGQPSTVELDYTRQ